MGGKIKGGINSRLYFFIWLSPLMRLKLKYYALPRFYQLRQ